MVMESDTGPEPAPTDPGFPDRVVAKAISARHLTGSMGTCGSGFQHWNCGTDQSLSLWRAPCGLDWSAPASGRRESMELGMQRTLRLIWSADVAGTRAV